MTVQELKNWLYDNDIPDWAEIVVLYYERGDCSDVKVTACTLDRDSVVFETEAS